jgi:YVTN family beta-propeller protein
VTGAVVIYNLATDPMTLIGSIWDTYYRPLYGIAISPNGQTAYVCNYNGGILVIDVPSMTLQTEITTGLSGGLFWIAITPDGSKAYVTNVNGYVFIIDLITQQVSPITIPTGLNPQGIAITPNSAKAYVCNSGSGTITVIDLSMNTTNTITVGGTPVFCAISPDGTKVYVTNQANSSEGHCINVIDTEVDQMTRTIQTPDITPKDIAITPDGKTVYVTDQQTSGNIININLSNDSYTTIHIDLPSNWQAIAITPDQAPIAAFSTAIEGTTVVFDASTSISPVGNIATYSWDFGDGHKEETSSPTISHQYAYGGLFSVVLTVTNTAGTSTSKTYTGQMVLNNGDSKASIQKQISIENPVLIPPKTFKGFASRCHKSHKVHLFTKWKGSTSSNIIRYEIFAYHKKIASIKSHKNFKHTIILHPHHDQKKHLSRSYRKFIQKKYRIRAVSSNGTKSNYTHLKVTH